jgi:hypothetical protein
MSNNNNDNTAGAGLAILGAGLLIIAVALFAVFAFVTAILSVLCLIAIWKPITIRNWTLGRDEALDFLFRGCIGAWLVPAFVLFCDGVFTIGVDWDYLLHMMGVGYVLGSLGWEVITANSNTSAPSQQVDVLPPSQQIAPPPSPWARQEPEAFRYASWDDEEELRK